MGIQKAPHRIQMRLVFAVLKRAGRPLMCGDILKRDSRIARGALHRIIGAFSGQSDDQCLKVVGYKNVNGRSQGLYILTERGIHELAEMRVREPNLRKAYRASTEERHRDA